MFLDIAQKVLATESKALAHLASQINPAELSRAVQILKNCTGRIVVSGMGKSGLIGKKIAATFASTGSPSFFLHPAEALHGDLGMLMPQDVVLSISNSGETDELLQLIPYLKKFDIQHISLVGRLDSTLAGHAQARLYVGVEEEVSPIQSVPMASCLNTLAMGDVLATILIEVKNFRTHDFALLHPAGALGRKLLHTVAQTMQTQDLPITHSNENIKNIIFQMTKGRWGLVLICQPETQILEGIITDGDLRRALHKYPETHFFKLTASDIMTRQPKSIAPQASLLAAEELMQTFKITALPVLENDRLAGLIGKFLV